MKFKALLPVAAVLLISQLIFSCSSKEYFSFSPAAPAYTKAKPVPINSAETNRRAELSELSITTAAKPAAPEAEPELEATTKAPVPVLFEKKTAKLNAVTPLAKVKTAPENQATVNETTTLQAAKERLTSMSKAEKKELRKEIKQSIRENAASDTNILLIILAILIPPLAVGLYEGITTRFWISLLLTLLFFIPGVIYALLVVTDSI